MANNIIRFEDHVGLVHMQAKFGLKWASGSGLALTYDDMFQEASLAFVISAEGFQPELGLKFSTYYTRVAFSQFRRAIGIMTGVKNLNPTQRAEIEERKKENDLRLEEGKNPLENFNYGLRPVCFSHLDYDNGEDSDVNFESTLRSNVRTPEEIFEHREDYEYKINSLSSLARLMFDWLTDPPDEMLQELSKKSVHDEYTVRDNARNNERRFDVSIANIGSFVGLISNVTNKQISAAKRELFAMAESV